MSIITIDPGYSGMGYAIWKSLNHLGTPVYPIITENVFFSKKNEDKYFEFIESLILEYKINKGFIEQASYFSYGKGQAAASSGALIKLVEFIGRAVQVFKSKNISIEQIPVQTWKDSLPKVVIERRVNHLLPDLMIMSHSIDAVGIGLYLMGFLKPLSKEYSEL